MSLKTVSNELALLLDINLKYLSTKTDKYENEISYFAIEIVDFDKMVKDIPEHLKMPYWRTPETTCLNLIILGKFVERFVSEFHYDRTNCPGKH